MRLARPVGSRCPPNSGDHAVSCPVAQMAGPPPAGNATRSNRALEPFKDKKGTSGSAWVYSVGNSGCQSGNPGLCDLSISSHFTAYYHIFSLLSKLAAEPT